MTNRRHYFSSTLSVIKTMYVVLLLGFPMISFLPYFFFVRNFVPSMRLASVAMYVALLSALAVIILYGVALFSGVTKAVRRRNYKEIFRASWLLLIPLISGFFGYMSIKYPFNYLLHCTSSLSPVTVTERVVSTSYGGKHCRYSALLEEGTPFYRREVCHLSLGVVKSLAAGGMIELSGDGSD